MIMVVNSCTLRVLTTPHHPVARLYPPPLLYKIPHSIKKNYSLKTVNIFLFTRCKTNEMRKSAKWFFIKSVVYVSGLISNKMWQFISRLSFKFLLERCQTSESNSKLIYISQWDSELLDDVFLLEIF